MKIEISHEEDTDLISLKFSNTHTLDLSREEAIQFSCLLKECASFKIGCDLQVNQDSLFQIPYFRQPWLNE